MRRMVLCGLLLATIASARAAEEPLWELGAGIGIVDLPDYRGADQRHVWALPIPYFVYRGDRVRVDRGGVHGDLIRGNDAYVDISGGLGPPVKSSENRARAGMPDIKPTIELGPSLEWTLLENRERDRVLAFLLPVRAVFTTRFDSLGWTFSPNLNMDFLNLGPGGGWNFGVSAGPLFATEKYHDYYYEVSPQFATAERPTYNARGGYSGSRLTFSLSKRFSSYWFGAFARYDTLKGAVFEDSPLIRKDNSFMAGFGVSWIFARSPETVTVPEGTKP